MASPEIELARKKVIYVLHLANVRLSKQMSSTDANIFSKWFPNTSNTEKTSIIKTLKTAETLISTVSIQDISANPKGAHSVVHKFYMAANAPTACITFIPLGGGRETKLSSDEQYIALYPEWFKNVPYRPTRLLHEIIHFTDPSSIGHDKKSNTKNAFRFQGFVSELTKLPFSQVLVKKAAGV